MPTWEQIDQQFLQLREQVQLHYFHGARWNYMLDGGDKRDQTHFEALAKLAGQKLADLNPESLPKDVISCTDPLTRWYEALRHMSGDYKGTLGSATISEKGIEEQPARGHILEPAAASRVVVALCMGLPAKGGVLARLDRWLQGEEKQHGHLWRLANALVKLLHH